MEAKEENKRLKKDLEREKKVTAILRDATAFFVRRTEVKFRGIVLLSDEGHPVELCCEFLNVSRSGFYDWKNRLPSKRRIENEVLKSEIKEIHKEFNGTYGSPRINAALEPKGHYAGKNKVAKLMKEENIKAR